MAGRGAVSMKTGAGGDLSGLEGEAALDEEALAGVHGVGVVEEPRFLVISWMASPRVRADRYGRCETMASTTSATARMRAMRLMSSPRSPFG